MHRLHGEGLMGDGLRGHSECTMFEGFGSCAPECAGIHRHMCRHQHLSQHHAPWGPLLDCHASFHTCSHAASPYGRAFGSRPGPCVRVRSSSQPGKQSSGSSDLWKEHEELLAKVGGEGAAGSQSGQACPWGHGSMAVRHSGVLPHICAHKYR